MSYIMSTSLLLCLVVILASLPRHKTIKPFWRNQKSKPKPTLLPSIEKDPEFYRKLREEIPPKNETAKKFIKNFLRIRHRGKRSSHIEDVVIVMDGSGSIRACEFNNGKKALKALMQYEQPGKDAKYAMVTFASQARRDFNFLPQLDAAAKMSGVKFPGGPTNTQAGLAEAFDLFRTGSRGFDSREIVLLLTDGHSNKDNNKTVPNAQKLKENGVDVFVVAIGGQHMTGIHEMAQVATFPPENFLFRVEKVGDFFEIVKMAIEEVAPGKYKILKEYKSPCK